MNPNILIIDDDPVAGTLCRTILEELGYKNIHTEEDSRKALDIIEEKSVDLLFLDLFMPHESGQMVLEKVKKQYPQLECVIVTSSEDIHSAVECMKLGAYDYIVKPLDVQRLSTTLKHLEELISLKDELHYLRSTAKKESLQNSENFEGILTESEIMISIFRHIEIIAPSRQAVLVTGESGTGKELIAKAIHDSSGRKGEYVAVNVAGIDDHLFSDTLFGHKKGAFTGADTDRDGLIEKAHNGTLFLDEIGDLELSSQVKLLRLLQENEYYPVGSDTLKKTNARVIAATNVDLPKKMQDREFRSDLYYRLMSHHIFIPPLRDRFEDLRRLIPAFIREAAEDFGIQIPKVSPEVYTILENYDFPGNIRELKALIDKAVSFQKKGRIPLSVFKEYVQGRSGKISEEFSGQDQLPRISYRGSFPTLEEVENHFISLAMEKAGNNQSTAASLLGISQSTLSRRYKNKDQE